MRWMFSELHLGRRVTTSIAWGSLPFVRANKSSACLPVCQCRVRLSVCLSVRLIACLRACLSCCLYVSLSACLLFITFRSLSARSLSLRYSHIVNHDAEAVLDASRGEIPPPIQPLYPRSVGNLSQKGTSEHRPPFHENAEPKQK